jgi:hypothetical protein
MEHQEGAGEPRRRAREGGEPIHRVRVQLGVQDHLVFKLMSKLHMTSVLDVLYIHGKLRR